MDALPRFANGEPIVEGPLVILTHNKLTLDGLPIDNPTELTSMMKRKRELWQTFNLRRKFPGIVLIEAPIDLPFERVKRTMKAAALAGYPNISFIGIRISP